MEAGKLPSPVSPALGNPGLRAVQVGVAGEKLTARMGELNDYLGKAKTRLEGLIAQGDEGGTKQQILDEMRTKYDACKLHIQTLSGQIGREKANCEAAQTHGDLKNVEKSCEDIMKKMNKEATATLVACVKNFNSSASSLAKKSADAGKGGGGKGGGKGARPQRQKRPTPPLHDMMMEVAGQCGETYNITESSYETKGGLRACALQILNEQAYKRVQDQPVFKKARTKITAALKTGTEGVVQRITAGKVVARRFAEVVQAAVGGAELFSRFALPRAQWAQEVYDFEVFGTDHAYVQPMWPNFGMMQAMIVDSGTVAIAGIPNGRVPGSTFKEKVDFVSNVDSHSLLQLITNGGFYNKFTNGADSKGNCIFAVPSGFLIITAGVNARILRWAFNADQSDLTRTKNTLQGMIDSFPEEFCGADSAYLSLASHWNVRH